MAQKTYQDCLKNQEFESFVRVHFANSSSLSLIRRVPVTWRIRRPICWPLYIYLFSASLCTIPYSRYKFADWHSTGLTFRKFSFSLREITTTLLLCAMLINNWDQWISPPIVSLRSEGIWILCSGFRTHWYLSRSIAKIISDLISYLDRWWMYRRTSPLFRVWGGSFTGRWEISQGTHPLPVQWPTVAGEDAKEKQIRSGVYAYVDKDYNWAAWKCVLFFISGNILC